MKKTNELPPVHPGEILKENVLPSVGLSVTAACEAGQRSRRLSEVSIQREATLTV